MKVRPGALLQRSPRAATALLIAAAIVTAAGLLAANALRPAEPLITIRVDAEVDRGTIMLLRVTDSDRPPLSAPLDPGVRHGYVLEGRHGQVPGIRLELTEAAHATVRLYSITVAVDGAVVRTLLPPEIAGWSARNVASARLEADRYTLVSAAGRPTLEGTLGLLAQSGTAARLWARLGRLLEGRSSVQWLSGGVLLFALVGWAGPRRRWHLALLVASGAAAALCIRVAVATYHGVGPIDGAVGRAAYLGQSFRANHLGLLAAALTAVGLALLGHRLWPRLRPASESLPPESGPDAVTPVVRSPRAEAALFCAVLLGLAWLSLPDLPGMVQAIDARVFEPGWDANNLLVWGYLAHGGYAPLRDFWYPYGHWYPYPLHAFLIPDVSLALLAWTANRVLLFWGVFYGIYRGAGNRIAIALFGTAVLLVGENTPVAPGDGLTVFWFASRYLPSLLVVLTYVAIPAQARRFGFAHGVFGGFCALAMWGEVTQLLYAAPAVLAILLVDLGQQGRSAWRLVHWRLLREFAFPALSLALLVGAMAWQGSLAGAKDFYLHFGDLSQYGAVPTDAVHATRRFLSLDFVGVLGPIAMLALGAFEWRRQPRGARGPRLLVGLALVGFMVLLKHLVRPIAWQVFLVPAAGMFFYLALWRSPRRRREALLLGGLTGVFVAMLVLGGAWRPEVDAALSAPRRLVAGLGLLLNQRPFIARVNRDEFAPARFRKFHAEQAVAGFLRGQGAGGQVPQVYVLGDANVLYPLLGQLPPYQMNLYSSSPIYEQQRVVDWLQAAQPPFVLCHRGELGFDDVPHVVRDPLIYNAVIAAYVPLAEAGGYDVLRRRKPGEPVALDFWRAFLGGEVALGHLARFSSFERTAPCPAPGGEGCSAFLDVTLGDDAVRAWSGKTLAIPFTVGGHAYTVSFAVVPGQSAYRVLLPRVWFWQAAQTAGLPAEIAAAQLPAGVRAAVVSRQVSGPLLY